MPEVACIFIWLVTYIQRFIRGQVVELYKDISASFEDLGKEGDGRQSVPTPPSAD